MCRKEVEIETVSLLVRLYEHKINRLAFEGIVEYAKWYYPNQNTEDINHYIKLCLLDLNLYDDVHKNVIYKR